MPAFAGMTFRNLSVAVLETSIVAYTPSMKPTDTLLALVAVSIWGFTHSLREMGSAQSRILILTASPTSRVNESGMETVRYRRARPSG